MNLKTKNEIIKVHFNTSELGLIVEHMYFNLSNVTENFTENMKIYKKYLDNHVKKNIDTYKYYLNKVNIIIPLEIWQYIYSFINY